MAGVELSTTSYSLSRPYALRTLLLSRAVSPALDSMPVIFPPNREALPLRSARELTSFMYDGTVSSRDVLSYQAPRSSSLPPYFFQYCAWVVGSQAPVMKSTLPEATEV